MKRLMFSILLSSCFMFSLAQQVQETVIKGKLDGIKSGRLYLLLSQDAQGVDTLASCDVRKSRFEIKTHISEPLVTQLVLEGYTGGFTVLAEPGARYDAFLSNGDKAYIRGGKLNEAYTQHMKKSDSMRLVIDGLQQRYNEFRTAGKFRSASLVNDTLGRCRKELQQMTRSFLSSHDDLITAYTLYSNIMMKDAGLNETREIYNSMGPGAKATHCARMIKRRIELLEETQNNAVAPDFTAADPLGNPITMSSVPAKVKIIDFWASWCGPCRLNNPALKQLYEDFHDKGLEIIGVSLDNNADKWKGAIEKDDLGWINVSTLCGWTCEIARRYNVKAIPAMFVLDNKNRIIASGLRGKELRTFIEERLK